MGITGSGKSFYAVELFARIHREKASAIYIDPIGLIRRKPQFAALHPICVRGLQEQTIKDSIFKNGKVVFEPNGMAEVEKLIKGIMAWKRNAKDPKDIYIFCDEIHNYGQPTDWHDPVVKNLFTQGRNFNIIGIAITQSLSQIREPAIVNNCQVKICFSMSSGMVKSLRTNYTVEIPDEILEWINVDSEKLEGERSVFNAAVLGLSGNRWVKI